MRVKGNRRFVAIIISLFLLVGGFFAIIEGSPSDFPDNKPGAPTQFSVTSGMSGTAIANSLAKSGVILKASTFIKLAIKDARALSISPGLHKIDTHITSSRALDELVDPHRISGLIRVIEGSTYRDVISQLKMASLQGNPSAVKIPNVFPHLQSLEGLLGPATYSFQQGTTIPQALNEMIATFISNSSRLGLNKGYKQYSPYQVLTVASLVQIEADPKDYAKVAGVIYNRLKIGMPLQLNSSVQYALNLRGRITLTRNQTLISSPYNTYRKLGLPPTPISNPSSAAISAALSPDLGDWIYFITVTPHDTRFTKDYSTFQDWVTLYNKNVAKGAFK